MIERFTRTDAKHIAYEVTIDDPKIFTKPWTNKRIFTLRPDWEIMEYSCEENNKDFYEGHIKAPPPAAVTADQAADERRSTPIRTFSGICVYPRLSVAYVF